MFARCRCCPGPPLRVYGSVRLIKRLENFAVLLLTILVVSMIGTAANSGQSTKPLGVSVTVISACTVSVAKRISEYSIHAVTPKS